MRDGLGPYLSIYLLLTHHWDQASIGFVMGIGGLAAIAAQTPVGAAVDRTTAKRALIVAGALTVTAGTLAMPLFPRFFAISLLQALTGVAGSVFAPALAAITLGLVGTRAFSRRIGRNESFNHAGNATAGAITGGLAYCFGPAVVFWVLAAMLGSVSAAHAADMPDLPVLRGAFTDGLTKSSRNWEGAYVGGQVGYEAANIDFSRSVVSASLRFLDSA